MLYDDHVRHSQFIREVVGLIQVWFRRIYSSNEAQAEALCEKQLPLSNISRIIPTLSSSAAAFWRYPGLTTSFNAPLRVNLTYGFPLGNVSLGQQRYVRLHVVLFRVYCASYFVSQLTEPINLFPSPLLIPLPLPLLHIIYL